MKKNRYFAGKNRQKFRKSEKKFGWKSDEIGIKFRNDKSARQEGITMRIEAPKIEVSNLEGAIQGSKVIQIIWFNLLWCILLGPQLSPVSSVLLLDIIFIDWVKVNYGL